MVMNPNKSKYAGLVKLPSYYQKGDNFTKPVFEALFEGESLNSKWVIYE